MVAVGFVGAEGKGMRVKVGGGIVVTKEGREGFVGDTGLKPGMLIG